nr:unnamed protein product [Digitaria exilis]
MNGEVVERSYAASTVEHRAKGRLSNSSEPLYLTLDKDRREKVVKAGPGVPVKGASAYPGVIITTCTSHLGTVEHSLRGGWHYWQRPSGENAAGAKRGGPAPGEHREEREPGRWKSQGKPGHLTEMEAACGETRTYGFQGDPAGRRPPD